MYWEQDTETMGRTELEALQLERLRETVGRAVKSPYYEKIFRERGIDPAAVKTIRDVARLPLTTKDDLRDQWP